MAGPVVNCNQCSFPVDILTDNCIHCGHPLDDERKALLAGRLGSSPAPTPQFQPSHFDNDAMLDGPDSFRGQVGLGDFGSNRVIWEGKPNPVIGPFERRFTHFSIKRQTIDVSRGVFNRSVDKLPVREIEDVNVFSGPLQRWIRKVENIHLVLRDQSGRKRAVVLNNIPDARRIAEEIRTAAQEQFIASGGRRLDGSF